MALKILNRAVGSLLDVRRFVREARILSEFHHRGIVSYVDSGQTADGLSYLAMEWLEGEDLSQRLLRGPLSVQEVRQLLERVAEALACAHQVGIVHRDIKPSNLFLCNGHFDRVVVLDFGVAQYADYAEQSTLTRPGSIIGTDQDIFDLPSVVVVRTLRGWWFMRRLRCRATCASLCN